MPYRSPFSSIVYSGEASRPSTMEYRVVFTAREPWLAIIELRQTDPAFSSPVAVASARDQVVNRVLDGDLRGLPLGALRLVATDDSGSFEYQMQPDIHDYLERGNRYKATPHPTRSGQHVERIEINQANLVAGRVRVDTVHATAAALSDEVAAALG
ncbi:hypothetical protein [Paraburkholderia acidisoli]|uniref:Uncharacterized protein n=1 Tax=Paraburkholderia acidisoli TaxID=2571748 RepID=A0A7Z2JL06_9BURK|nr:hypothetical protein [Paraburkholderia acidisoli]QGZ67040.1 hypothetical protein FAZ98_35005 [Paraburkholderia acidisoli]